LRRVSHGAHQAMQTHPVKPIPGEPGPSRRSLAAPPVLPAAQALDHEVVHHQPDPPQRFPGPRLRAAHRHEIIGIVSCYTDRFQGLGRAFLRTKSITARLEIRFEDWLDNQLRRHLHHSSPHHRDPGCPLGPPPLHPTQRVPRDDVGLLAVPLRFPPETPPRLVVQGPGSSRHRLPPRHGSCAAASMLPTERHSCRSGRTSSPRSQRASCRVMSPCLESATPHNKTSGSALADGMGLGTGKPCSGPVPK
jgi:hypothetical protein